MPPSGGIFFYRYSRRAFIVQVCPSTRTAAYELDARSRRFLYWRAATKSTTPKATKPAMP